MKPSTGHEPRKYPLQRRAKLTVAAILGAAAHILESGGLVAMNTNRVAERAGVSIGSLYQYFPTREAILSALIRQERSRLLATVTLAANQPGDVFAALSAMMDAAVAHQLERPLLSRALELAELGLPLDEEARVLNIRLVEQLQKLLLQIDIRDTDTIARDLVGMVKGMVDAAGWHGEHDAAGLKRRVASAVFAYLSMNMTDGAVIPEAFRPYAGMAVRRD